MEPRTSAATPATRSAQVGSFLKQHAAADAGGGQQPLLLNRAMRVQPDWPQVEVAWENLRLALGAVIPLLEELGEALADADVSLPAWSSSGPRRGR